MRLQLFATALLAAGIALAATPKKQALITFPKEAPDHIVDSAKNAIIKAGGIITHEFTLIKGFVAQSTAKALDEVRTLSIEFAPTIEDDNIVHANAEDLR